MQVRTIGIDLGLATAHTATVVDETAAVPVRKKARPTLESLRALALHAAPDGTRLQVVMDPTGAACLPVAGYVLRRGHLVYRVASAKSSISGGSTPCRPRPTQSTP